MLMILQKHCLSTIQEELVDLGGKRITKVPLADTRDNGKGDSSNDKNDRNIGCMIHTLSCLISQQPVGRHSCINCMKKKTETCRDCKIS